MTAGLSLPDAGLRREVNLIDYRAGSRIHYGKQDLGNIVRLNCILFGSIIYPFAARQGSAERG